MSSSSFQIGGFPYECYDHHCTTGAYCLIHGCQRKHGELSGEIDRRLTGALIEASRGPLGMPATVDTLKAMLTKAGLGLVLLATERARG